VTAVPERGDFVHLDFDPQAGHEQRGARFGLVVSSAAFNRVTGFAFIAPVTSQVKGYPFEVVIPQGQRVSGVVLADQTKSLDWHARGVKVKGRAPEGVVDEVLGKLEAILLGG
jgi:mRNA interferase MazF